MNCIKYEKSFFYIFFYGELQANSAGITGVNLTNNDKMLTADSIISGISTWRSSTCDRRCRQELSQVTCYVYLTLDADN